MKLPKNLRIDFEINMDLTEDERKAISAILTDHPILEWPDNDIEQPRPDDHR